MSRSRPTARSRHHIVVSRGAGGSTSAFFKSKNVAYVVALALRHSGFVVRVVGTGAEALRLSIGSPMPDIVVLDVMLPDLDGFEVCRRMRADRNDLPVLFLTAKDAPADRLYGLTIGGDDYLLTATNPAKRLAQPLL